MSIVNNKKIYPHIPFSKIWFFPYELKLKKRFTFRFGALLKVEFINGETGHADLHPWPEKGEMPLKVHLDKLRKKEFTGLCLRAIAIAWEEAQAQAQKINMLNAFKIPLSHYLILDIENFPEINKALNQGFKTFKVKLNHPLKQQTQKLSNLINDLGSSFKWRLDFYMDLNEHQWQKWVNECLAYINPSYLDFIEVPFYYQEQQWVKHERYPLALDVWNGENTLPVSTLIWKSSRKSITDLLKKKSRGLFKRVIFTHGLSHPLDQLSSACFSARFYKIYPRLRETCGLVQGDIYESHAFSLPNHGPVFPCLSGIGWGFDSILLDNLKWKNIFNY